MSVREGKRADAETTNVQASPQTREKADLEIASGRIYALATV